MSKERKALGPEPPKAFIEVDGEERELPGPVKFDLKSHLYKNNWPEDYAPAFNLDFNALTLAVQSLNESFYEWAKPLVGALSQFADTFNEHFHAEFYPLIQHPIRDKSKGGWIAWYNGKWRKCERVKNGWQWSE